MANLACVLRSAINWQNCASVCVMPKSAFEFKQILARKFRHVYCHAVQIELEIPCANKVGRVGAHGRAICIVKIIMEREGKDGLLPTHRL